MSARIARGSAPRGKAGPGRRGGRRGRSAARPAVPDLVRRLSGWMFVAILAAVAVAALLVLRVPQLVSATAGEALGEAGFVVKRVEIKGASHVPQIQIYNIAFDQPSSAMPLVDLAETRRRLLQFGWVREARVSRRLPDTLVIEIEERRPTAVWQHRGQLALVDSEGVVLEPVRLEAMPDLPLVIGPAANRHAGQLRRLTAAAPQLRPMIESATWVGGRRWDLRFQSGELLSLPEGEEPARKAFGHFARMDQATQLLGRGFARFDMRIAGKFIVRVSSEPGTTIESIAPPTLPPPPAPAGEVDPAKTI